MRKVARCLAALLFAGSIVAGAVAPDAASADTGWNGT